MNDLLRIIRRASKVLKRIRRVRLKRRRRELRRELIHIAGCTYRGVHKCASIDCLDETLGDALALGVSIPRSLRARARRLLTTSTVPTPEL